MALANFAAVAGDADKATFAPDGPAGLLRVTVIFAVSTPPNALDVLDLTVITVAGVMDRVAVFETVPSFAVTVRVLVASTGNVVRLNVAVLAPAAIVALFVSRVAKALFERLRLTGVPLAAPFPEILTVPVMTVAP